jgi:hypothetical protein
MSPIDESPSFESDAPAGSERKRKSQLPEPDQQAAAKLVSITVDAATGRVVGIEGVDARGERHEISNDERSRLIEQAPTATLRDIVEQAFEAGISCVLGQQAAERETPESEADADLSRVLLQSLIRQSVAKRLIQFDVLSPAIVGTLIERASYRDPKSESGADH